MIKRSALKPRLAEVGKIKIGGKGEERKTKSGGTFRIPAKFDHFVVTTTERTAEGNFKIDDVLMDKLGGEPREISIRLLFDDIDMNFFTEFQFYVGRSLVCRGDGETARRTYQKAGEANVLTDDGKGTKKITVKEGDTHTVPCSPDSCPLFKEGKCKPTGILSCAITDSMELGGVYRFRTHSWNSISSIVAALEFFASNTKGILTGLPLKLKMVKKTTEEHGDVQFVTVVLDGLELSGMRQAALVEMNSRKTLELDMNAVQQDVRDSGFFADAVTDAEDADFYVDDAEEDEPEEKGVSGEDIARKLAAPEQKAETETEPEPSGKNDIKEGDLF